MSKDTLDVQPSDAASLAPGESFRFSCTQCGECCFDQLVLLDPFDLFYLGRAVLTEGSAIKRDLFAERVVELVECDGEWRCALVMPSFGRGTKCRFLAPTLTESGEILRWGCELHEGGAKPLVCLSSPVARDVEGNFYLVAPVSSCPGMNRGQARRLDEYLSLLQIEHRQRLSQWFHREVRPLIESRERAERIYHFDREIDSVEGVESYLREVTGCRG